MNIYINGNNFGGSGAWPARGQKRGRDDFNMSQELDMSQQEISQHKAFRWIIPNFTREYAQGFQPGSVIYSENIDVMFEGVKTTWNLEVYPNGVKQNTRNHLSLLLYLSSPIEIKVRYRLDLIKATGDYHYNDRGSMQSFTEEFSCGYNRFISHNALFAKHANLLSNNKLTISCEFVSYAKSKDVERPVEVVARDLQMMFESGVSSDFELRFSFDQTLKAHKFILIARSPVFFKMLTTDMKEAKDNYVDITDFDSSTMKELLRFIYSGEVRNLDYIATDLIFAAEKYQIKKLKEICGDHIASKLSTNKEKVLDALIIADRISGLDNLIKKCVEIVEKNYKEFFMSPKWKQLSMEMHNKILEEVINHRCDTIYIKTKE